MDETVGNVGIIHAGSRRSEKNREKGELRKLHILCGKLYLNLRKENCGLSYFLIRMMDR